MPNAAGNVFVLTRPGLYDTGRAGRVGSIGGDSSSSIVLALLGGVPKGERWSGLGCICLGSGLGTLPPTVDKRALGFSARFTGGGTIGDGFASRSLFISADLRGGGGEGGWVVLGRGDDRRGSGLGVLGRLGILKGLEEGVTGVTGVLIGSGFRRAAASTVGYERVLLCGGE